MAPFLQAVERAGLSAIDLGASVGITPEMLSDPSALAPANSIYRFAELASDVMGEPHLGVKLGLDPEITQWPVVADAFLNSSVMVEFFARFLLDAQKFTTKVDFRLQLGGEVSWFERDRGFAPSQMPAQIDAFSVGLFVNLFREALGDRWQGAKMTFRVCDPEVARIKAIGNCALAKSDARTLAFSFPSEWLVLPLQRQQSTEAATRTPKPPSDALIAAIRSNIRLNLANPEFGVPYLVEQMGFNRRSVQKYLRERGSGLADLIEEERRKLAFNLLEQTDQSLEEISQALGYTDVSNFSRAFRRWSGVAPSNWREGWR
ncbi:AraC family transcriptional regulator [Ruegeria sediminis]|uniref:AraC family transcriptional regulator n=2 Tax=Ruegeria sediminis TaxID=2583820 RepID=A0ABY2WY32_9RHOB|nr:AraC family transcriptional regulator [Ruegeria sediminis]